MQPTIIKNDPLVQRIRESLKKFKEQVMEYANLKLKIWKEKNQKEVKQKQNDRRNNFKNKN